MHAFVNPGVTAATPTQMQPDSSSQGWPSSQGRADHLPGAGVPVAATKESTQSLLRRKQEPSAEIRAYLQSLLLQGVLITHRALVSVIAATQQFLNQISPNIANGESIDQNDVILSYLPLVNYSRAMMMMKSIIHAVLWSFCTRLNRASVGFGIGIETSSIMCGQTCACWSSTSAFGGSGAHL